MAEAVREGFLCPVCMADLGDVSELQRHFERVHPQSGSGSPGVGQIRELFGRAKERLKGLDSLLDSFTAAQDGSGEERSEASQTRRERRGECPQEPGLTRSHTALFQSCRQGMADQAAVETNTLIIRLDKLISKTPTDAGKKRSFEKGITPWMSNSESKLCTVCLGRFNPVSRRKHHCRLCGKLTCSDCSHFLSFLAARRLTEPSMSGEFAEAAETETKEGGGGTEAGVGGSPGRLLSATLSLLKRDGSEGSLGSLLSGEGEDELRICRRCETLLRRREEAMERRTEIPVLFLLYQRLQGLLGQLSALAPSHARIALSLSAGESLYSLQDAAKAAANIAKLQEEAELLSKKILNYGEGSAPPAQALLQLNIRRATTAFLQDAVLALAPVPSPEEYALAQAKHRLSIQERVAAEKAAAMDGALLRPKLRQNQPDWPQLDQEGWTPHLLRSTEEDETQIDPLREQISIIRGFLSQAAQDGRLDEVAALEENLRELQAELDSH